MENAIDIRNLNKVYRNKVIKAKESGETRPRVPEYIGECFLKISENLAWRPNFINYTFRDDLVSDGIENCLLYAHNFNPEKSKNPFSYFTQIAYFAFIRRIVKEKKQADIKFKFMEQANIEDFVSAIDMNSPIDQSFLDTLREKISKIREVDTQIKDFEKAEKVKKKKGLEKVMSDG